MLKIKRLLKNLIFLASLYSPLSSGAPSKTQDSPHWHYHQESIMGTQVQITLWQEHATRAQQAIAAVVNNLKRIDAQYSPYKPTSALSQLNEYAAKAPQPVSKEFYSLLEKSIHYGDLTEGAFDITFASIGFQYDYRNKKHPSAQQTEALLPAINYQWLQLDKKNQGVLYKHPNVKIDLGGIAKGYAVDQAIEILKKHGIGHATVSAGGDSKILGDKKGQPWLIGIKNPRLTGKNGERTTVLTLPLENTAVSTSGDYERYFIDEHGKRVHHILNPKTGKPTNGIISATVIGPNGVDTDALSTSIFVLGIHKALTLINSMPNFDCVIIDSGGQIHFSEGLKTPS